MTRLEDFTNKREEYLEFIKISFAQKRKKWLNSLKNNNFEFLDLCEAWLMEKGYPLTYRAEQITVDEFKEIFNRFSN
jgi:16S rRNA A1518/A1519 N6-dimethyltransferase RsmA/KsgA/DIM1 with predicted DNA glycosylase/AP lyase activity